MELQLVSKEIGILAKELGFNWECDTILIKDDTLEGGVCWWKLLYYECGDGYIQNSDININHYFTMKLEDIIATAPTQELLAKWLRDNHNIWIYCNPRGLEEGEIVWLNNLSKRLDEIMYFHTYEEAMEDGLERGLNNLKEIKKKIKNELEL